MEIAFIYEAHRIYVLDDYQKIIVEATFPEVKPGVVDINHTFVDPSLRGQGIAAKLMDAFYLYVKKTNHRVIGTCPYAVVWFERNKDKQDVLVDINLNHPECPMV